MRITLLLFFALLVLPAVSFSDPSRFDQLMDNLARAEQAGRWRQAIALEEEIIAKHRKEDYLKIEDRSSDIGSFHMYLLEFDAASKIFLDLAKADKDRYGSAALSLARISVERGDFKQALIHLKGYASAFGSGCGNCLEARSQRAHIYRTLWQYGLLPKEQARKKWKQVAAGNFKPLPGRLTRSKDFIEPAAREAKLLLAGMLQREGKNKAAKALYSDLASGKDEPAWLAKAYQARVP